MTILVLLWLSTLCVIYISSYMELSHRNQDMLQRHVEMYTLSQDAAPPAMEKPGIDNEPRTQQQGDRPPMEDMPAFQLSTFYSVAMDANGTVLETNNDSSVYTSEELENMARAVIAAGETTGTRKNLLYYMADKGSYTLVAFMDNTIMRESMTTLFRYTLLFGALAILALFFVAVFLARKIVRPLEENHIAFPQLAVGLAEADAVAVMNQERRHAAARHDECHLFAGLGQLAEHVYV